MHLRCRFLILGTVLWALQTIAASVDCSVPPLILPWSNITVSTNGVAVTRGIELGIGTPNQIFSLRPSTTLNNTRIANVLDCGSETNTSCVGGKGGVFDSAKSSTFVVSLKNRWNGSAADTEAATGAYVYFNDVIDFQVNGTVLGYPLVENSDIDSGPEAGLPLGQNSSFLAAVTQAKVAPSSVWGLDAGDRSLSPRDGSLMVGGYDNSRVAGQMTTFPIGNWTQQPCPLQVTVAQVDYFGPDNSTRYSLFDSSTSRMVACVEPFQQRSTFLPSMVKRFANLTQYNATYVGLTFPTELRPNGSLDIILDNGYRTIIPNDHLFNLKRGSDDNGHYVVTNSSIVETGIANNVDENDADVQPILGGLFLTFNYLVVDYDNNHFQMAPSVQKAQRSKTDVTAVCTPSPITLVPDSEPTNAPENGSSRAAAIGGGTAGGVIGLAAIAGLCYVWFRKRRREGQQEDLKRPEQVHGPMTMNDRTFSDRSVPSELALTTAPIVHELPDKHYDKKLPPVPDALSNSYLSRLST
ncbi:MAG: hypothetical protein Q9219_007075 [cf. Caloplaca sp. 3 TL-2023]